MQHFSTPELAIVAYTAGLLDGEGAIWAVGNRFYTCITQGEKNNGEQLCRWLQSQWGIGTICCQRKHNHENWWPVWVWHIAAAREVRHYLNAVMPYLFVRKARAEEALAKLERYITEYRRLRWTPGEIEFLRVNGDLSHTEVAKALNRSRTSVRDHREALGLLADRR